MSFLNCIILNLIKSIFIIIVLAWVTNDLLISKWPNQRVMSPFCLISKALTLLQSPLLKFSPSLKLREPSLLTLLLSLSSYLLYVGFTSSSSDVHIPVGSFLVFLVIVNSLTSPMASANTYYISSPWFPKFNNYS